MPRSSRHNPVSRVTLNDVAKAAGVSAMTVSNVINGKHVGLVGHETIRRVEREVKRLGYRPHEIARSLRLARSFSIGMVIVTSNPLMLAAQFISTLVTGVASALQDLGYSLVTEAVHPDHFDRSVLLRRAGLDGVVAHLAGTEPDRARYQELLKSTGLPLVLIQDRPLVRLKDHCCINQDDFHGGTMLAQLALDLGARNILFVTPQLEWPAVAERGRGIRSVLADRGRKVAFNVVSVDDESLDAAQNTIRDHIARNTPPDFILCSNDQLAVAALKLMQAMGRRVPEDVGITGFNNFEFRRYTNPTLTTVQSEIYEMGFRAGRAIVDRIEKGVFGQAATTLPVSLVIGGSTATPALRHDPPHKKPSHLPKAAADHTKSARARKPRKR